MSKRWTVYLTDSQGADLAAQNKRDRGERKAPAPGVGVSAFRVEDKGASIGL